MNQRGGKKDFLCTRCCLLRNAVLSVQLSGAIAKESALAFRYVTRGINLKFKRDTAADFTLLTSPRVPYHRTTPSSPTSAPLRSLLPLPIPLSFPISLFLSFFRHGMLALRNHTHTHTHTHSLSLSATLVSSNYTCPELTGGTTTRHGERDRARRVILSEIEDY